MSIVKPTRRLLAAAVVAATAGAASSQQAVDLVMVTGTPTGTWFPTGAAFAEFAADALGGQPISVQPGAGSIGNIMSVASGQADLGLSYGAFLKLAEQGGNEINPGEPIENLRGVLALTPNVLHVLMADDAPALSALAEEQPRIAVGTGVRGSTEDFGLERLLGAHGVTYDDIEAWGGTVVRDQTAGRNEGWQNRQFDIVSYMFTPPNPNIERMLSARDGALVAMDPDIQQRFVDEFGFAAVTIPAGSYPGQDEDVAAVGLPTTLFATEEVPADVVYEIVKGAAERLERLHQVSAAYEALVPAKLMEGVGIELHEGAERYYRERGWL